MGRLLRDWFWEVRLKARARWWLWILLLVCGVFEDRFMGWVNDVLDSLGLEMWPSTKAILEWLGPLGVSGLLFLLVIFFILVNAYFDAEKRNRVTVGGAVSVSKVGPLRLVGYADQSQISLWGDYTLTVRIRTRFENEDTNNRFVKSFTAYVVKDGTKRRVEGEPSLTEVSSNPRTFELENGMPVAAGMSSPYYLNFHVPKFAKNNQTFEIEMEALGQAPQKLEIVPEWSFVDIGNLVPNTVREIRELN